MYDFDTFDELCFRHFPCVDMAGAIRYTFLMELVLFVYGIFD